jgi:F-type H+-transporting ATPase subunit b
LPLAEPSCAAGETLRLAEDAMATETTTAGAAHAAEAEAAVGMPQLDFATFPNQIFWLVVALVAIYYILDRIALPRITAVLAERNGTIGNDIAAAEELKLKAAQAEAAYKKALADARAEAQKIAAAARAAIQADLGMATEQADARIAARVVESKTRIAEIRDSALASVEFVAKDTTGAIVAALGQRSDEATVAAAVEARMSGGKF